MPLSQTAIYNIFRDITEGVVITDKNLIVTFINPVSEKILGWSNAEAQGVYIDSILDPQNKILTEEIHAYVKQGSINGNYNEGVSLLINRCGNELLLKKKISEIRENNVIVGYYFVFINIEDDREECAEKNLIEKYSEISTLSLKAVIQNSTEKIFFLNDKFRFIEWSDPCKLYFYEQGFENEQRIKEIITEEFSKTALSLIQSGSQIINSNAVLVLNNKEVVVNVKSINEYENVIGYYILIRSELLENSEKKIKAISKNSIISSGEMSFKTLAENSPDIIYIIDLKKRKVIYFNRNVVFGYPSSELEFSDAWIDLVHPDDLERVKIHWNKFLINGSSTESLEYRLKGKGDNYEWVINRHTIIEKNEFNEALYALLNITIITERKKVEEALKQSEARLTSLVENTNDIIWSVDSKLQFTAMNSSFKNLFRKLYKKNIIVGDNLLDVIPNKLGQEWLRYHERALDGERFSIEFNGNIRGQSWSYEISYNPVYNEIKNINGVSVFGRDITLRKAAENDIIRTNFELDSFVYRASHDLRAPLRSVLGLINIVKTEENAQQRNLYLNLVDKSVNKLDTFIADLTNFSRNSRMDVKIESVDFKSIIEESIENLKYMDNASIIEIRTDINDKLEFWSDSGRISIILQNLLSNSIKYRNANEIKSFVIIQVNISKNFCEIRFEDNGKGIKSEYLDKIFNMFFRASADSYGSGLGLYITKQVVEKLNGTVSVASTLGKGSVFNIKLPNLYKT